MNHVSLHVAHRPRGPTACGSTAPSGSDVRFGGKAGEWRAFQEPRLVWRHVASTTVAGWLDAMNLIARWCPARVPDNAPVSSQAIIGVTLCSTTAWYWFTPYGVRSTSLTIVCLAVACHCPRPAELGCDLTKLAQAEYDFPFGLDSSSIDTFAPVRVRAIPHANRAPTM